MLMRDYLSGDIYHGLARMCGLTDDADPLRWKRAHPDVRQRMKPLQLAITYGMGVPSLARGLEPPSADRQRNHRDSTSGHTRGSGSGARPGCRRRC